MYSPYPPAPNIENSNLSVTNNNSIVNYGNNIKLEEHISRPNNVKPCTSVAAANILSSQLTSHNNNDTCNNNSSVMESSCSLIAVKRPQLSSKQYESLLTEDESRSSLYDYSLVEAW